MARDRVAPAVGTGPAPAANFFFHKWATFIALYIGYTLAIVNRKAFSFIVPALAHERLSKDDLGLIASSFNLAYTVSKFLGGVLSDKINSKLLFSASLFLSGLCTVLFPAFSSVIMYTSIWFLHGIVQGGAWPACAKVLKHWFSSDGFGTWYGVMNTTLNLACSFGPLVSLYLLQYYEWRGTMVVYGFTSIAVCVCGNFFLVNSPVDIGFESFTDNEKKEEKAGGRTRARGRGSWQDMLKSPFMWVVCVSFLVVFTVRTATLDWAQLYLIDEVGHAQYMGSIFISSLEVGGFIGSVAAGYLGDKMVAMSRRDDIRGTPRMTLAISFVLLYTACLHMLLFVVGPDTPQVFIAFIGLLMGVGLYGPVTLYGVMAIEAAPSHLTGTSGALVALSANVGAVLAGLPFSYIANFLQWRGAFIVVEVLSICVIILKIATRKLDYKMVAIRKKLE